VPGARAGRAGSPLGDLPPVSTTALKALEAYILAQRKGIALDDGKH
jgi:hypothetical protein